MASVKVLMSGIDITNDVVSYTGTPPEYVVSIPKVTGNVEVIAVNTTTMVNIISNCTKCTCNASAQVEIGTTVSCIVAPNTNCYFRDVPEINVTGGIDGSFTTTPRGDGSYEVSFLVKSDTASNVFITATAYQKHTTKVQFFNRNGYSYSVTADQGATFKDGVLTFPATTEVTEVNMTVTLTPDSGVTIKSATVNVDGTETSVETPASFVVKVYDSTNTVTITVVTNAKLVVDYGRGAAVAKTQISVSPALPLEYDTTPEDAIVLTFNITDSACYWKGFPAESGQTKCKEIVATMNDTDKDAWTTYISATQATITIPANTMTNNVNIGYYEYV